MGHYRGGRQGVNKFLRADAKKIFGEEAGVSGNKGLGEVCVLVIGGGGEKVSTSGDPRGMSHSGMDPRVALRFAALALG